MNNYFRSLFSVLAWVAVAGVSGTVWAEDEHRHSPPPPANATVDFGVLPTAPLGPSPCLQTGAIGGPTDPCSYKIHHLAPEETTIAKGGLVTFQVHGGGHGVMLYQVSKNTTRDMIGQALCPGSDPSKIGDPALHVCNLKAANADASHIVVDGKGDIVIEILPNATNTFPDNRVYYEPGRLISADGAAFLNGGTPAAPAASNGISYRFLKAGRYLVMCMNRTHALNDWMFGFVTVVESDKD